ncbi:hypothetical protein P9112_008540 [Eukaryota sp. TZLM1-RC]
MTYKNHLAISIVKHTYGDLSSSIVESLLTTSHQTLKELMKSTSISYQHINKPLLALITNNIVLYLEEFAPIPLQTQDTILIERPKDEEPISTKYFVNIDHIFLFNRLPKLYDIVRTIAGPEGVVIVETLLQEGRNYKSILLDRVLHQELSRRSSVSLDEKNRIQDSLEVAFSKLAENQIIWRHSTGGKLVRRGDESVIVEVPKSKRKRLAQNADQSSKLLRDDIGNDLFPDLNHQEGDVSPMDSQAFSETYWSLNSNSCLRLFRHGLILSFINQQHGELVHKIFRAFIICARGTEPSIKNRRLGPVAIDSMCAELAELGANALTMFSAERVGQVFEKLKSLPNSWIEQEGTLGGGSFVVNISNIMKILKKRLIQDIITKKFDSFIAGRIYALLLDNENLEEKIITELCVCSPTDSRRILHAMLFENYVQTEAKGADKTSNKATFYYSLNKESVVTSIIDLAYEGYFKLYARLQKELKDGSSTENLVRLEHSLLSLDDSILVLDNFSSFD